ncbi:MAG: Uma2 family endonuclease [Planctomycetes bacterium]|nr:Uma2 family endonuclease [Planctomycetota bacterium]
MNELPTQLLEPEDLLAMPDGDRYELIDGMPKEKPMGAESDEVAMSAGSLIRAFVKANRLGHVYGSQTGFQCFPKDSKAVRMPDTSYVATGRLPNDRTPEGYIKIAPDLAVEVISPNETYEEVEAKVKEYRSAGVKLIWVVSPKSRTVLIRRLDGTCAEVDEAGTLSGEDVIPGFACPVVELFV